MEEYKYKISVIVPVYNNQKYIDKCMHSLINQTIGYKNIQVVLINDGSIDNSLKVMKRYEDDNVIIIDKENTGVSDTRNIGMSKALGKYILFLDSDDYLSKSALKNLYVFFEGHYDEIDLVTYPIVYDVEGELRKHKRYEKVYTNGTGVYDLNLNYNIIQTTVNIMVKNKFKDNPLFEVKQNFSEDERFSTSILMEKQKIGFCKGATYYYRRHVGTANDTITNPMYSFETITSYYEFLFKKYRKKGKVEKYIQSLYLNNIGWRIKQGDLFPLHLMEKEYIESLNRMKALLEQVSVGVIINSDNLNFYHKIFLLNFVNKKIKVNIKNKTVYLFCEKELVYEFDRINADLYKYKIENGKILVAGSLMNPLFDILKPTLYVEKRYMSEKKVDKIESFISNDSYHLSDFKTITSYGFDITMDLNKVSSFKFYVKVKGFYIPVDFKFKRFTSENYLIGGKNLVYSKKSTTFRIRNASFINFVKSRFRNFKRAMAINKKECIYRFLRYFYPCKKNIWLYSDRLDAVDNAYVQFNNDFNKNDGVNRFYVCSFDDSKISNYFDKSQRNNIIKYGTLKHKMYYLNSKKIITSFSDVQIYCPFKNNIRIFKDLIRYQLVYLQHGILHASLIRMYAKEFTEIDRFVVSSNFERENMINKYHYKDYNLLLTGMPRYNNVEISCEAEDKILFAPSWRKYLIGNLINNKRRLKKKEFVESKFYKEIYGFLHSKELEKLLTEYNYTLDFKLHPIFKGYSELFELDNCKNIVLSFDKIELEKYKVFITDFSSFQFDFVRLKRPIMYFLPDELEFKAGLHTYRELDLKYEDAFGPLCLTQKEVLVELTKTIKSDCKVENKYLKRMDTFFIDIDDPCNKIYDSITSK